jgi:gas vesicle protein
MLYNQGERNTRRQRVKDFFSFVGGVTVGAAIGAAVILFTTPQSGEEQRQSLSERWNQALEMGKRAARDREQELWADFNTRVKAPAGLPITGPATSDSLSV